MTDTGSRSEHRGRLAAVLAVLLAVVGGGLLVVGHGRDSSPPQPDAAQQTSSAPPADAATPGATSVAPPTTGAPRTVPSRDFGPLLERSAPVTLQIPSIGVHVTSLVGLHLNASGQLEAPRRFSDAGWYVDGPAPGQFGPAVIAAHVDSKAGPAVFYRLGALHKGAKVVVGRADRTSATFVIDRVARYSKADFPTSEVYSPGTGRAEVRLITCGGAFDRSTGHYVDNIVAFGHLLARA